MALNQQQTATTILNAVWKNSSKAFQSVVPYLNSNSTINEFAKPILAEGEEYEPIQNEFVKVLVNRIAFTMIEQKSYTNRLKRLKKGYRPPLGTDVQHIYTNPINPLKYNGKNLSAILTQYDNDTKVAYYRRNRQDMFPLSVNREQLAGAFVSWETFNTFVSNLVNAIYSGDEIREYNLCKQTIVDAVNAGTLVTKYIEYPDATNSKDIVKELRTVSTNMTFPSSKFNKYKELAEAAGAENVKAVQTWCDKSRQVIIIRTDILEALGVEVLASAFNMSEVEFRENHIPVDDFGYDIYDLTTQEIDGKVSSDIGILVADEATFQIYDNLKKSGGSYNDATMTWQFFYHVWQTYGICPFSNAVAYITSNAATLLGIEVDKTIVTLAAETTSDEIAYHFTPENFDGEVQVDFVSGTKDGAAITSATGVVDITVDDEDKTVTIAEASSISAGVYELKFSLHTAGKVFPNVIISVGVTKTA